MTVEIIQFQSPFKYGNGWRSNIHLHATPRYTVRLGRSCLTGHPVHAYTELNVLYKACSHQDTSVGQMAIGCAPGSSDR